MLKSKKRNNKKEKVNSDKIKLLKTIMKMIKQQWSKKIFTGSYDCGSHLPLVFRLEMAWKPSMGRG